MHIARVIGTVVATKKIEQLEGSKLLILQPMSPEGEVKGSPLVSLDTVGVGPGDIVYYVRGREAAHTVGDKFNPADAAVMGIVDKVDL
ncbi:MAG: EutN/CcmL family microcompartment protein [bacterium]|jgi:ethanolamine utilization protein EutN